MRNVKSEFLRVAKILFEKQRRPMTAIELIELAKEEKLLSDKLAGKTLHQTMKSKISVHIRRNGDKSPFIRTKPGRFYLRYLLSEQDPYISPPFLPSNPGENVLVFPSTWLDQHGDRFQGIEHNWEPLSNELFSVNICWYKNRLLAEQDEEHKQIITYILVCRDGQLLAFKRGTFNLTEEYLRGSQCIGFGGHVSLIDRNIFNISGDLGIKANAIRELSEEINLPPDDLKRLRSGKGLQTVGLLNDDSSAAGRRHFAYIFKYEVANSQLWNKPQRGERSITQLRWLDLSTSKPALRDFEYWSQLCLREYFPGFVDTQPSFLIRRKNRLRSSRLLCVLGTIGSGKSEATKVLCEEFGYTELNTGRVLSEIIGLPSIPDTDRHEFQEAAWKFISEPDGPIILASHIWNRIRLLNKPRILIDGIRQRATFEALQEIAGDNQIGLVYVHTPPDISYHFYRERNRPRLTIHEFLQLYDAPVERDVPGMIAISDVVVYNWTGRLEYRNTIRRLMSEIRASE